MDQNELAKKLMDAARDAVKSHTAPIIAENKALRERLAAQDKRIDALVGREVKHGKDGKDGVGIADAIIDRNGHLVLTLSGHSETKTLNVGLVVGKDGDNGKDGNHGKDGAKGDVGPKGEQGEKGAKGSKGEQGLKGDTGEQGEKGAKGDPGTKGEKGIKGEKGEPGKDGITGAKGDTGTPGVNGLDGKDGTIKGEIEHDGLRTFTISGQKFLLPIPIYKGVFDRETAYDKHDTVTYAGGVWIAQKDTRQTPGADNSDWKLQVKRGPQGSKGEKGDAGSRGAVGDKGEAGRHGRDRIVTAPTK